MWRYYFFEKFLFSNSVCLKFFLFLLLYNNSCLGLLFLVCFCLFCLPTPTLMVCVQGVCEGFTSILVDCLQVVKKKKKFTRKIIAAIITVVVVFDELDGLQKHFLARSNLN